MNEPLTVVGEKPELNGLARADAPAIWDGFRVSMEELRKKANTLQVTEVTQTERMAEARDLRLALRDIRIAVEARRVELGAFHLRQTQNINAAARELKASIEPLETRLLGQELFVERERERRERDDREARMVELAPYLVGPVVVDLGKLSDKEYCDLVTVYKGAAEARAEQARKYAAEEAERMAAAEMVRVAQAAEVVRLRLEVQAAAAEREAARVAWVAAEREAARVAKEAKDRETALVETAKKDWVVAQEAVAAAEREAARVTKEANDREVALATAAAAVKAPPAWFVKAHNEAIAKDQEAGFVAAATRQIDAVEAKEGTDRESALVAAAWQCAAAEAKIPAAVQAEEEAQAVAKERSGMVLRVDGALPANRLYWVCWRTTDDTAVSFLKKSSARLLDLREEVAKLELSPQGQSLQRIVDHALWECIRGLIEMTGEMVA